MLPGGAVRLAEVTYLESNGQLLEQFLHVYYMYVWCVFVGVSCI